VSEVFLKQFTHNGREGDKGLEESRFGYWENKGRLQAVRVGSFALVLLFL